MNKIFIYVLVCIVMNITSAICYADVMLQPLSSWNDGVAKTKIINFVHMVTEKNSPDFVPVRDRIAVFDNDGTLWAEKPVYFQLFFVIDRIKALSKDHPSWKNTEPYKSILNDNLNQLSSLSEAQLETILMDTHAGMSTSEFKKLVQDWIKNARNPVLDKPILNLTYLPMQEVIELLVANDFKVYIVSGGGVEFMRAWTEDVYGIPPENVIGSTIVTKYSLVNNKPTLIRLPKIEFVNDNVGKPVAINKFIGKRPIVAFGNSDGDFEMLEWTTKNTGPRLGIIIHHTDNIREFAYDRNSKVGHLERALDQAEGNGWVVVDMKNDWNTIYKETQPEIQ